MPSTERWRVAELVSEAQGGSEVAFALLARDWDARLVAHAWRLLGDREAAREAAQSAWLEIARGIKRLREPVAFPAWAFRITTRQAAAIIRARQGQRRLAAALERAALTEPQSAHPPEPGEGAALSAAIGALPPDHRAAIALHHFEGLSVAEAAVAMDVPVGTLKTRLMHARLKLRAALEGETHD